MEKKRVAASVNHSTLSSLINAVERMRIHCMADDTLLLTHSSAYLISWRGAKVLNQKDALVVYFHTEVQFASNPL